MPKRWVSLLFIALCLFGYAASSQGAATTSNLTVNTTVAARASLVLASATINFPDSDPTTVPSIGATENAVNVTARVRTGSASTATLQVLAGGDLTSGSNAITIDNVTWTATGAGFTGGTMNKTTPQAAGSWTGPGVYAGTFSYFLANSWNYATGNYSATITYTLTAP
ncbi:hypothetical protein [Geomobilimonas luticola]|uniref:DUF4402 domain-containing protein n=1 Tax=Geomobilimonas luticola TaxID=1114878 RepID=A0ABS5SD46_9BACT|nr:hypothetical protein [Geomobilimonas luticola]MBT0653278.1 hypothetical protein [Geomobilimonas luticola]